MSVQEFALGIGEMLKLGAARGAAVRVRSGDVWLTQHGDRKDHMLKTGDTMPLNGEGTAIITAYQPTILELYREDPIAVRKAVEHQARRARNNDIGAFFARVFCKTNK
ncbi:MAG: DUF2917 domain-containing protein [Burkholderiales bacterium]